MGRTLISPVAATLRFQRFSSTPKSSLPIANAKISPSFRKNAPFNSQTRAVLSEFPNKRKHPRVGAGTTGTIPAAELLGVVELAAKTGAEVEFVGGPMCWNTRIFSASSCGGAFCNGHKINVSQADQVERSLLVTGFGYEHDDAWATNMDLFKHFTDKSRGVRRLGAAAVDMSHVALGIVEAYWEYRLKPWDMAAGVLIVEEAGGSVTCMDGGRFSVFDRSVLVSNGIVHEKLLERIGPATEDLKKKGIDFSLWFKPESYVTDI